MKYYYVYDTEIGPISLVEGDKHITNLTFGGEAVEGLELKETTLIKEAKRQLDEYFGGRRMIFDLPIKLEGTEFQKIMAGPRGNPLRYDLFIWPNS